MSVKDDIVAGKIYGNYIVISPTEERNSCHSILWRCLHKGKEKLIPSTVLRSHNCIRNKLKSVARTIIARCYNPKHKGYKIYGGRGIHVCQEWKNNIELIVDWMIDNGWKEGLEIDRINNNGHYCPSNCRITTKKENCKNRRSNRLITIGSDIKTLSEWCDVYGINYCTVHDRIKNGWDSVKAVITPVNVKYRNRARR
jgi:hypothetical protein